MCHKREKCLKNYILIEWLQRASEAYAGKGEAFCKICRVPLRAHKTDLLKHAKTITYNNKANSFDVQRQPVLASFGTNIILYLISQLIYVS